MYVAHVFLDGYCCPCNEHSFTLEQSVCESNWWRIGNSCFRIDPSLQLNWTNAVSNCTSLRSTLAQVDDVEELCGLGFLVQGLPGDHDVWVGGHARIGTNGEVEYRWLQGEQDSQGEGANKTSFHF